VPLHRDGCSLAHGTSFPRHPHIPPARLSLVALLPLCPHKSTISSTNPTISGDGDGGLRRGAIDSRNGIRPKRFQRSRRAPLGTIWVLLTAKSGTFASAMGTSPLRRFPLKPAGPKTSVTRFT
jgi:hypothetical protein